MTLTSYGQLDVAGFKCHYANASYSVEDDQLIATGLQAHLIGCGDVADDSDWWFVRMLANSPTVTMDGANLTLDTADTAVDFKRHAEPAAWILDPNYHVSASTTELHVFVLEGTCASGQSPEGRILPAEVTYTASEIDITIMIQTLASASCPGNAPYPWTVTLPGPVGNRQIPTRDSFY